MNENDKNMAENSNLPQKWINTPFAFTRLSKNLTLLQQAVLVKVSEQLQPFIQEFFGSDLARSRKIPKSLFSEAAKNSGVTQIYIPFAELGIPENNYYAARQAVADVLKVTIECPKKKADGTWGMAMYNVFASGDTAIMNSGVVFSLNPQVIDPERKTYVMDYVFNMAEGYVSHPDNIALIGEVARMPMMYYILRDASGNNWKEREISLTVRKIKTYLGMIEVGDGEVFKEAYPKFSQFKKNVLDTSIADINRLKEAGLLDICVSVEPIYNGKRKVGNPAFLKFRIYDSIAEMQGTPSEQVQTDLFGNPIVHPASSKIETKVGEGTDKWKAFCKLVIGDAEKSLISRISFVGMKNGRFCVECSDDDFEMIRKLGIEEKAKEFFDCKGSFAPVFYRS